MFSTSTTAANLGSYFNRVQDYLLYTQRRVATGRSVFTPADDAVKSAFSSAALVRSLTLGATADTVTTRLKTLEAADLNLKRARDVLQQMNNLATRALQAGTAPSPGPAPVAPTPASGPGIAATSTARIDETTLINGGTAGMRLSITSDNGQNFTYTLGGPTSWGQVADAFNAANMGVSMRFDRTDPAEPRLVIESTDGRTGFTIDGTTSRAVIDDLTGLNSPYDGGLTLMKFAYGTGTGGVSPSTGAGMSFGLGAAITADRWVLPQAGSSLTFTGADGISRTWTASGQVPAEQMASEINAMNAGVRAEFTDGGRLRLRDISGGNGSMIAITGGTGVFNPATYTTTYTPPAAIAPPSPGGTVTTQQSDYGALYDAARTEAETLISKAQNGLGGLVNFNSNPLSGLLTSGSSWNGASPIATSLSESMAAQDAIDRLRWEMNADRSVLSGTLAFNREFADDLSIIGNSLVEADEIGESALLTALQIRQNLTGKAIAAGKAQAKALLGLLN